MKNVLIFIFSILLVASCKTSHNIIENIHIDKYKDNYLNIAVTVKTTEDVDSWISYWRDDTTNATTFQSSPIKGSHLQHILLNIEPGKHYQFKINYKTKNDKSDASKVYDFTSPTLPLWLQSQFATIKDSATVLPEVFKDGFMLLNKREAPGCVYLVDHKGRIRWYHMIDDQGIKVTHFTKDKTILSIVGKNDEPTSYGSEILELNLYGDTVNYLKKGKGDMKYSFHHEILKDKEGNYVTLFVDKRIFNLEKIGGSVHDTINGDGIMILNKEGKTIWKWSVFDVVNPLLDKNILKDKKDWMHANSVNYDADGNFLISFYNSGQIWKINAKDGTILWKFGNGGNIKEPNGCQYSQAHAVHMIKDNVMLFFNNGIDKRISEAYGIKIDEEDLTARLVLHIKLPPDIYNDRMGSVYQVNDSLYLCCSSKRKIAVVVNKKGTVLWDMETAVPSYRIEFIKKENLSPFIAPIP